MKRSIVVLIALIVFISCSKTENAEANDHYIIQNVNVVDVENGIINENQNVTILNDKIISITNHSSGDFGDAIAINGEGKYLIPGLWDMHTHYNWNYEYSSSLLIANGVVGVREMWGDMDQIEKIRKNIKKGKLIAPDTYTAGVIIDGEPKIWKGSIEVTGREEAIEEAQDQINDGVDFLKIYSNLSRESFYAIAEKSKESGVPFAGHVPSSITMWEAIEAGQQSTEHLYGLLEACSNDQDGLKEINNTNRFSPEKSEFLVNTFDKNKFDSILSVLSKSDTWISPTLIVLKQISNLDDASMSDDPRMKYMPQSIHEMWNPSEDFRFKDSGAAYYNAQRSKFELLQSLMGDMEKAGVKIIAGTDFPNPYCFAGFSMHDELELLVEGGMSNIGALRAATINPAIFMKKDNQGLIKEGFLSSLVLLNDNPLEDISNTKNIEAVFLRGKYMDSAALDNLLQEAKEYVSK